MASIEQIQKLMREWEQLPTLDDFERHLVQNLREVADKGHMVEFEVFRKAICVQFWGTIYSAIQKGRQAGLGAKEY